MTDVVLLNDVFSAKVHDDTHRSERRLNPEKLNKWNFWSRYLGPYVIKQTILDNCPSINDVVVVDYFTKIPDFFDYIKDIVNEDTKYIGISTSFLHNVANVRVNEFNLWFTKHQDIVDWFAQLKQLAPNAKILLGGHNCDVWYKEYVLNNEPNMPEAMRKYVDCIIHGYGEDSVPNYINNTVDLRHVQYRYDTLFVSDGATAGRHGNAKCIQVKWDKHDAIQRGEWLPLEVSKGCKFGCKFCMYDKFGTTLKPVDQFRQEVIDNYERYGVTGYSFTDDTINDSMEKVKMIHEVFTSLPFNVEWIAYTRPDMFHKSPEMLDLMLESGCKGVFLGVETFNHKAAKIAGKGLHPDKIKEILRWMKEKGGEELFILASFIVGLVGETEQSLQDTLDYLLEQDCIDKILFEVLYIRPPDYRTGAKDDFNNDQEKYGFKKLNFKPYYWEHDTLNYTQCQQIAQEWKRQLGKDNRYSGFDQAMEGFTNFWSYPRMRSLGYSHKESFYMLKDASMPEELYRKNNQWIDDYHQLVKENNARKVFNPHKLYLA